MKQLTCLALIVVLAAVVACAPKQEAPPQEPQSETASDQPITQEDFEAGEPESMEQSSEDEQDDSSGTEADTP